MSKPIRAFFALKPDEDGLDFLTNRIQLFRARGWEKHGRFIESANLHVTMRFLGDLKPDKLEEIQGAAEELASKTQAFTYELARAVLFPRVSRARVIASKINATPEMRQLNRDLEKMATEVGLKGEKWMFRPHVTLARLKQANKRPNLPARPGSLAQKAETLYVLQSTQTEFGHEYSEIAAFPFTG